MAPAKMITCTIAFDSSKRAGTGRGRTVSAAIRSALRDAGVLGPINPTALGEWIHDSAWRGQYGRRAMGSTSLSGSFVARFDRPVRGES